MPYPQHRWPLPLPTPLTGGPLSPVRTSGAAGCGIFASITALTKFSDNPLLAISIFTAYLTPVASVAAWGLMVDRNTIAGVAEWAEESIENHWYTHAAEDTFHPALVLVGVLGVVSVLRDFSVTRSMLAIYFGASLMITFAATYSLRKWREGLNVENRVKQLREERSLPQQKLADSLGVSRQTIISIEKGRYDPLSIWGSWYRESA